MAVQTEDREVVTSFVESLQAKLRRALPKGRYVVRGRLHLRREGVARTYRFQTPVEGGESADGAPAGNAAIAERLAKELRAALPSFRGELSRLVREALREASDQAGGATLEAEIGDRRIPVDDIATMLDEVARRSR